MTLVLPAKAFDDKVVVGFLNKVLEEINAAIKTFAGLDDTNLTALATDEVLEFDGTNWVNTARVASTGKTGLVNKATASADASASTVSVASSDITGTADLTYDATERDMLNDTLTLANEMKADINTLVTDVNAIKDSLNDLKAKLRTAGVLTT